MKINVYGSCINTCTWSETSDKRDVCLHGVKLWKEKESPDKLEISIITLKYLIPEALEQL